MDPFTLAVKGRLEEPKGTACRGSWAPGKSCAFLELRTPDICAPTLIAMEGSASSLTLFEGPGREPSGGSGDPYNLPKFHRFSYKLGTGKDTFRPFQLHYAILADVPVIPLGCLDHQSYPMPLL